MKDLAHRMLANTWAVVALLGVAAACLTILLVTKTVTIDQTTGLVIALASLLGGAGAAWMRGTPPPGSVTVPVTAGRLSDAPKE